MALPIFEEVLYPFLKNLEDKDVSKKEMRQFLIQYFDLTEEECNMRTKGGNMTQLDDKMGWALQYLRRALFVEIPSRAIYRITQRGKEYLKGNNNLRKVDLLAYPEFCEYAGVKYVEATKNKVLNNTSTSITSSEKTPTDQLEEAFQSINNDLAEDILQKTLQQSPKFFEHLVVDLLVKMGYGGLSNRTKVTQYSHDDGIDGIIYEDKLGLDKIYIQAKLYTPGNTIGKPHIQQFSGALDEQKATKGVFITTSTFSKEARSYIEKLSKKIVLIDGKELAEYMIEYNVGVSTKKVYEVKKIDSDYFEDE